MRTVIAALVGVWTLLTILAYAFVLPDPKESDELVLAYLEVGPEHSGPAGALVAQYFSHYQDARGTPHPSFERVKSMTPDELAPVVEGFRIWYDETTGRRLEDTPRLIWSTDDNPARRTQCQLFRVWHLRTYGEPLDIATDPSNRDTTKAIVQCVAGAGPDLIESYGPVQLAQFVEAGVARDVTAFASERGFDESKVFRAAVSSMSMNGVQYAFPCNVGYTILFYHKDLFAQAGVPEPSAEGWSIDEMLATAKKLIEASDDGGRRRVGIMGLGAWGMSLADGSKFFNEQGTASFYNNPVTVAAFQSYLDLMYKYKVMPTPAELASMASAGGANMNMGAEAASASALFAAKTCAMISDGRWSYVTFAKRQLDRVIAPAVGRRLASLAAAATDEARREADLLRAALDSLLFDVLVPISDEQYGLLAACLNDDDRSAMLNLGVAHVPTTGGTPWYEGAARVAIVNRVSPRADLAVRFLEFLASEEYNNQINFTFDSISGTPGIIAKNGISGPPRALPGLEAFDSQVFVEAMARFAHSKQLSPYIGDTRVGQLAGPIMEQLTNNKIGPAEAARLIEELINRQIAANLERDATLRAMWERATGKTFDPSRPLREQVEDRSSRLAPPDAPSDTPRSTPRARREDSDRGDLRGINRTRRACSVNSVCSVVTPAVCAGAEQRSEAA